MSVERSFEAWEEVQRQSQDLADRLAEGFNGLINPDRFAQNFNGLIHSHITPPSFSWPNPPQPPKLFDVEFPKHNFVQDFKVATNYASAIDGVSAIFDMGNRLGKAGTEFGASVNGVVQQFFRMLPLSFKKNEDNRVVSLRSDVNRQGLDLGVTTKVKEDIGSLTKRFQDFGFVQTDGSVEEEVLESNVNSSENIDKQQQGSVSITSTYDSRRSEVQTSLAARGDLWRVEASRGNYAPGSENSSLFLVQLGPVLFVRDSTLLLPVHLSKQHLLWYGYDRKNGMHSICPAVWSKNRSWLLMSMICLNPLACSFMDLQLPNGQLTYVYGEGFSTSAFLPFRGGLLQAQGRYPGEMMFSYSRKNKWGTRITPTVQWPDKSFTLSLAQGLAWKRSGLMVKPSVQISLHPTFGGSNPGVRAEVVHSVKQELSLIIGCALATHPSAYASVSLGRSKWNGNVGSSGIVARAETPLGRVGRPWFSIQINSGLEF